MSREMELEEAIADLGRLLGVRTQHDLLRILFRKATDKSFSDEQVVLDQFDSKSEDIQLSKIISALISLTDGGMLINDFQKIWEEFLTKAPEEEKTKYSAPETIPFTILSNGKGTPNTSEIQPSDMSKNSTLSVKELPSKWDTSFGSVQFHNVALNFSNRYSSAATVFLSAIPTIEMSRCVPYVDVKIITNTKDVSTTEKTDSGGISLFRFLYGKDQFRNPDTRSIIDVKLVNPELNKRTDNDLIGLPELDQIIQSTVAGMELFTSPQTLVNGDEKFYDLEPITESNRDVHTNRSNPVLDKFRPFMTLNSLRLTVQPTFGTLSTKQGSMSITLHDRSRLAEISQLTSPGEFQNIEFLIEYGWSHPDPNSTYGKILNAFRTRQKFVSIGSSYSFNPQGETSIDINLITKGSNNFNYALITDGKIQPLFEKMKVIIQCMKKLEKSVKDEYESELKDIVNGGETLGKLNSLEGMVSLTATEVNRIEKIILNLDKQINNSNISELISELKNSVGINGNVSTVKKYKSEVENSISELLKDIDDLPDPYLKIIHESLGIFRTEKVRRKTGTKTIENPKWKEYEKKQNSYNTKYEKNGDKILVKNSSTNTTIETIYKYIDSSTYTTETMSKPSKYVSLGKLLYLFVASPLSAQNKFDEIQFLFYPLNAYSSFARNADVASFPILKSKFQELFRKRLERNPTLTLGQFINFINDNFFSNMASEAFGFGNLYERDPKTQAAVLKEKYKEAQSKQKAIDTRTDILSEAYSGTGQEPKFKKPVLSIHIECVPAIGDNERTIMRIHFADASTSSFESYSDLWNSTKSSYLSGIKTSITASKKKLDSSLTQNDKKNAINASESISGHEFLMMQQLQKLDNLGILVPVDDEGNVVSDSDNDLIGSSTAVSVNAKYYRVKGGPMGLRYYFARNMPTIKYGTEYSGILNASISTQSDPKMQMVHMERQGRKENLPGGEVDDGLPLRTFPVSLQLETFGCPLLNFGQQYFVDFQTGTTIDDIYRVNSIEHNFAPNDFKTSITLIPMSKSGEFISTQAQITKAIKELEDIKKKYE